MKIIYFNFLQVRSTNQLMKTIIHSLKTEALTVLHALYQSEGKGTFGKSWLSSEKNLTTSFAFFLKIQELDNALLTTIGSRAICNLLEKENIKNFRIKWPNDVMVNDKKIAGILCETIPINEKLCIILGLGLNINAGIDFLNLIPQPATSLFQEIGKKHDISKIKKTITKYIIKNVLQTFGHLTMWD
ncbi:MAG: biotin--[acetyl-CoA-carboxylase] ligase [Victivallaceae bacterium]